MFFLFEHGRSWLFISCNFALCYFSKSSYLLAPLGRISFEAPKDKSGLILEFELAYESGRI